MSNGSLVGRPITLADPHRTDHAAMRFWHAQPVELPRPPTALDAINPCVSVSSSTYSFVAVGGDGLVSRVDPAVHPQRP